MAVTVKEFFAIVDKARREIKPEQMGLPMKLNVGNPGSIARQQSGEWGTTPELGHFSLYFNAEGGEIMVFGG